MTAILLKSSPGNRNGSRHRETDNNEESGETDNHPAEECGGARSALTRYIKRAVDNREPHDGVE